MYHELQKLEKRSPVQDIRKVPDWNWKMASDFTSLKTCNVK
jgi:hypothetical protein